MAGSFFQFREAAPLRLSFTQTPFTGRSVILGMGSTLAPSAKETSKRCATAVRIITASIRAELLRCRLAVRRRREDRRILAVPVLLLLPSVPAETPRDLGRSARHDA